MARPGGSAALPVIDVAPLVGGGTGTAASTVAASTVSASPVSASAVSASTVAEQIQAACRDRGFFYVTGHGVPAALTDQLTHRSK